MSTTDNFTVNKGIPYLIKAKASGKWDHSSRQVFTTEGQSVSVSMENYDGLNMNYIESYQSADRMDFWGTLLPQNEMISTLKKSRYCLMPIGTNYENIAEPVYNFNVIGSPAINKETLVVSNFSSSNYIQLKNTFSPGENPWEIVIKFKPNSYKTGGLFSKITSTQYFDYGLRIVVIDDGHLYYLVSHQSGAKFLFEGSGSGTYTLNQWNWVKFEFTGSVYNAYLSTDGTTWTLDKTYTSSTKLYSYTSATNIGNTPEKSDYYFDGEVDLSACYIKTYSIDAWVDPSYVWLPAIVANYITNYDVVGSPAISADQVIGGFSRTSYIQTKTAVPYSSNFEIVIKFNTGTLRTGAQNFIVATPTTATRALCWGIASNGYMRLYLSSNGSTWNIVSGQDGTHSFSDNTDYLIKLSFNGSSYVASLSSDNGATWVDDITVNSSTVLSNQIMLFGGNENSSSRNFFDGTIDFKGCYININGSRWWSGAQLVAETLSGCIYNFTDDGSSTTLNAFVVNGDESIVLTPDNSYTNGTLLGTVSIPSHTVYTYNNGVWTEIRGGVMTRNFSVHGESLYTIVDDTQKTLEAKDPFGYGTNQRNSSIYANTGISGQLSNYEFQLCFKYSDLSSVSSLCSFGGSSKSGLDVNYDSAGGAYMRIKDSTWFSIYTSGSPEPYILRSVFYGNNFGYMKAIRQNEEKTFKIYTSPNGEDWTLGANGTNIGDKYKYNFNYIALGLYKLTSTWAPTNSITFDLLNCYVKDLDTNRTWKPYIKSE